MRKYFIVSLVLLITLYACKTGKTYKYIEVIEDEGILGDISTKEKEAKQIIATSDSSAYLEAYRNFCISVKIYKDMQAAFGKTFSAPKSFKLYNDDGVEISNTIFFADKYKREKEIEKTVFSLKNTIRDAVENSEHEKLGSSKESIIDSTKIKELMKYFKKKNDEYSNNDRIWYQPKSSPNYTNANGIYCYFYTENGIADNLRFRLQYYADDWLFFKSVSFSIDGKAYEYFPSKTETDSGDGGYIWEWFDESLNEDDKSLVYALANAKSAKMKLIGSKYYKEKGVTLEQINSIKRTLELYKAMGGKY